MNAVSRYVDLLLLCLCVIRGKIQMKTQSLPQTILTLRMHQDISYGSTNAPIKLCCIVHIPLSAEWQTYKHKNDIELIVEIESGNK